MTHGSRKSTRDKRVVKVLNWIAKNAPNENLFSSPDIAKDLNLTTQEVVSTFHRIDAVEKSSIEGMWFLKNGSVS